MTHATVRALAWLRGEPVEAFSQDVLACTGRRMTTRTYPAWGSFAAATDPKSRPTCPHCLVLMDMALEGVK